MLLQICIKPTAYRGRWGSFVPTNNLRGTTQWLGLVIILILLAMCGEQGNESDEKPGKNNGLPVDPGYGYYRCSYFSDPAQALKLCSDYAFSLDADQAKVQAADLACTDENATHGTWEKGKCEALAVTAKCTITADQPDLLLTLNAYHQSQNKMVAGICQDSPENEYQCVQGCEQFSGSGMVYAADKTLTSCTYYSDLDEETYATVKTIFVDGEQKALDQANWSEALCTDTGVQYACLGASYLNQLFDKYWYDGALTVVSISALETECHSVNGSFRQL